MKNVWIRQVRDEDADAVAALNDLAFGGSDESRIVSELAASGDSLASLIAHDDREILGHIQFFPIQIDGADVAAGLGPMSVRPDVQRQGIGAGLIRFGLTLMEGRGRQIIFVLGHPEYYPRFGFDAGLAAQFSANWSGPAFMARRLQPESVEGGNLTYPPAFEV